MGIAGVLAFAAGITATAPASAQEWLKDRRYQEGIGIRTGDLELHPGLAGEIGYDSNYLLRSPKDGPNIANAAPAAPIREGGVFRVTPSLTLTTLGNQRRQGSEGMSDLPTVAFRAGVAGTYREFIGHEELRSQRNFSASANLRLDILPQRPLGFGVFGTYERTIQPNTSAPSDPDISFNRDDIGAGAEVIAIPGGGTLDWHFGYQFHAALFEQTNGTPFNNLQHELFTRGRWKFRPRTALLYDGTLRFLHYTDNDRAVNLLHDSDPVRVRVGLNGLITPRFSVLGMVGYGASFFHGGGSPVVQQYDSVIGQAEAKFFLTANPGAPEESNVSLTVSSLAIGYTRDFQNSYLGDFYGSDRGYAKLAYMFAGRALVSLEGGLGAVEYPDIYFNAVPPTLAHSSFTDLRADVTLFGEYRFTNTFGLNTTLRYTANFSDTQLPVPTSTPGSNVLYDMNWRRFEAFIGARWFM